MRKRIHETENECVKEAGSVMHEKEEGVSEAGRLRE